MRARLRGPGGASTITLPDDATVGDLIAEITSKTSITKFDVKYGYPPKPLRLEQSQRSTPLKDLDVKLDGEQLTISSKDEPVEPPASKPAALSKQQTEPLTDPQKDSPEASFSFGIKSSTSSKEKPKPIALKKQSMAGDVPEIPMPDRGATLVLRVMPDDNSCLFRAFATAFLPTGDDLSMPELRSLVAQTIQEQPEVYTKAILDQQPDDYCRWIQTPDAWGGAIELGILSQNFGVEICSIDVQSLQVYKFNEGSENRVILIYSGIHYDTIVQSPSDPPHTRATLPAEMDLRLWPSDDDYILTKAKELATKLQELHYYTDTGGMAIRCNTCQTVVYGEKQATQHATQMGHYDMAEITSNE